jgi:hypothetical protein
MLVKLHRSLFLLVGVSFLLPALASGATDNETLTINATVGDRAKLVLAPTTINFPDEDPDLVDPIPADENAVSVLCNVRTTGAGVSTLTCLADGDLTGGGTDIPIANVTWTATGGGYQPGTMSTAVAQTVGSFTGSGANTGTLSYFLANSWSYEMGSYSQTVQYTLTTP